MKQVFKLKLRDYMDNDDGWGRSQGREVYGRLLAEVESHPEFQVFQVSLDGVFRTDASFPRESLVELAKRFRRKRGFCLIDIEDVDLLENWDAAATKMEQPIFAWSGDKLRLLGPEPSEGLRPLLDYIISRGSTTTIEAVAALGYNVSNTSNKLKALWDQGYLLRREQVAPSGGVEFTYAVPK